MSEMAFKDKFVAFVDILGFKEIVRSAEAGKGRSLTEIQALCAELAREQDQSVIKTYGPRICPESSKLQNDLDFRVTQISDCVIVSAESSPAGLINVVGHCWSSAINLLPKGIMVRGYITRGNIYHDGLKFFGTGYVQAYERESAVAAFKRAADEEGTPYVEIDPAVCAFVADCDDECVQKMFDRYVKSDGTSTVLFPFKVLAHSFGFGAGLSPFDGEREKVNNANMRRLIHDLKSQVQKNVEGANSKAQQKADHYIAALDEQISICARTDEIIEALGRPFGTRYPRS